MQQVAKKKQQTKKPVVEPADAANDAVKADEVTPVVDPAASTKKKRVKAPVTNDEKPAEPAIVDDSKRNNSGIHISRARCEWYMRNLISDEPIEARLKELKDKLKTLTVEDEIKATKNEINELVKVLFRISHYAPTAVSIICDTVVKDLIRYGINQVTQSGKKTLDVSHFQSESIKSLRYYSLISNSSVLTNFVDVSKQKKAEGDVVEEAEHADTMTFNTYIANAINDIKRDGDNDKKIIIGTRVKKFLSDLTIELIRRVMVITKALLKSVVNVRTIVPEHIKAVANILLIDGNTSTNEVDYLMNLIDTKLEEAKTKPEQPAIEPVVT